MLSNLAEVLRDIFIVIGVMTALLVVLIVIIAKMRADNPLKRLLKALSYRMGATIAAGALANAETQLRPLCGRAISQQSRPTASRWRAASP